MLHFTVFVVKAHQMCVMYLSMRASKQNICETFKLRLASLIARSGLSVSAFSKRCGLDRSALSQFLNEGTLRLPRSETLVSIAASENVSVDWLLGLSQDDAVVGEVSSVFDIEHASPEQGRSLLAQWHTEASGYKIRYAPSSLPDLLRTPAVVNFEFGEKPLVLTKDKTEFAREQLDYSRLPETDMEVVMPYQRLENLAAGTDIWDGLLRGQRQAQLEHMMRLIEELYPTFRLFLYDGRKHFLSPFTVFGPKRAAVYLGDMYMVINSVDHIRQLSRRFDEAIRAASIPPDRVMDWIQKLKVL